MKKYTISQPYGSHQTIRVSNKDKNPIIDSVEFSLSEFDEQGDYAAKGQGTRYNYCTKIKFNKGKETRAMREQFQQMEKCFNFGDTMDRETIVNQKNLNFIIPFVQLIQDIDPIPLEVFFEINERSGFDLTLFYNHDQIIQLASAEKHQEALETACNEQKKGDLDALILLANFYVDKNDYNNSLNALSQIPIDHPSFKAIAEQSHSLLLQKDTSIDNVEKVGRLEQKLKCALYMEEGILAAHYFAELCGTSGTNPPISEVKGDPDTLIQIAHEQRKMHKEIEALKSKIADLTTEDKIEGKSALRFF